MQLVQGHTLNTNNYNYSLSTAWPERTRIQDATTTRTTQNTTAMRTTATTKTTGTTRTTKITTSTTTGSMKLEAGRKALPLNIVPQCTGRMGVHTAEPVWPC